MATTSAVAVFWFRRDMRLYDNAGFYQALQSQWPVLPLFIFDRDILAPLEDQDDPRLTMIHDALLDMQKELRQAGSSLYVVHDRPIKAWQELLSEFTIKEVYTNHDYEPYAKERDQEVEQLLSQHQVPFFTYKDHVIFEKNEILTNNDSPYKVFTPYSRAWQDKFTQDDAQPYPSEQYLANCYQTPPWDVPSLENLGFERTSIPIPQAKIPTTTIRQYDQYRNLPAYNGTSRMSHHLRFGTISIRELVRHALELNGAYLNELVWRDFYMMILDHFPHVVNYSFNSKYDNIVWRNDEKEFDKWCRGMTGYPMVDAGMRQLNTIGYMHNRLRMVTASFLTKHLLIDWRWGERYFARKLLDYELSSNNGGWQWAAGCGTDAAPYFRIFNPAQQQKRFDPANQFIGEWVPEFGTDDYPAPMVDHKEARERALATYKQALGKA